MLFSFCRHNSRDSLTQVILFHSILFIFTQAHLGTYIVYYSMYRYYSLCLHIDREKSRAE